MSPVLECNDLTVAYDGVPVVRGVTLSVEPAEVVALFGPNGAGKTTTLLALAGILPTAGGSIQVCEQQVRWGHTHQVARHGLCFVPDDRALFYGLSARQNLRLGVRRRGDVQAALRQVTEYFPALSGILDRRTGLLSGGEQQMLALGRALAMQPKVLMVDEMSLGLAPIIVQRLLPAVRRIAEELGVGVLLVEQHVELALGIVDRAYVLDRGRVVLSGAGEELRARRDLLEASYMGELSYDHLGDAAAAAAPSNGATDA